MSDIERLDVQQGQIEAFLARHPDKLHSHSLGYWPAGPDGRYVVALVPKSMAGLDRPGLDAVRRAGCPTCEIG
jgi:hypothetical protein